MNLTTLTPAHEPVASENHREQEEEEHSTDNENQNQHHQHQQTQPVHEREEDEPAPVMEAEPAIEDLPPKVSIQPTFTFKTEKRCLDFLTRLKGKGQNEHRDHRMCQHLFH